MSRQKVVLDTSVLIQNRDWLEEHIEKYEYIVCSTVADELDNQKESDNPRRSFNGRTGLRFVEEYEESITFVVADVCEGLPEGFDLNNNDNKIISCAIREGAVLATKDRGLKIKAESIGLECAKVDDSSNEITKGYKVLELNMDVEEDALLMASIYEGSYDCSDMFENEYLMVRDLNKPIKKVDKDGNDLVEFETIEIKRHSKGKLLKLKLPPKNVVKPMNDLQRCALDLLNNDDIPVKIVAGGFGSGKSLLTTKMAVHKTVDKGIYGSIMALRNPNVEGESIGYLKGSKEEKTDMFFTPFIQHLEGGEFEASSLQQRGVLKKEIIGYIKGLSIGSTFIVVDEAEDLTLKNLKMCGSRIEETSCICFVGDYKQTHDKYLYSSGLLDLIDKTLYSEYVGVVVLEEDLRSSASKVFADI